ncbi:MAG: ATP-binding protein [bacterium]|nr:ATP-binding protein [bacterium]
MDPKQWLYDLKVYAALPEMRPFWIFAPLVLVIAIINYLYLPGFWVGVSIGLFLILGVLIFFTNLRLARSNLQIKVERNQMQSVIKTLHNGIIAYDPEFRILIFNPAAEVIFGIKPEEVVGKAFGPDKAQESRYRVLAQTIFSSLAPLAVTRSAAGEYPQVVDLSFDEPTLDLRVMTTKIIDPAGKLMGFMKIIENRSRELGMLRSKSEFITVAAHQLRTPLTAVDWALANSLKDKGLPQGVKDTLEIGKKASQKLLHIVNDLLDVSKIEEGRFGYRFENVEFLGYVENILGEASLIAKEYGVNIYFDRLADLSIAMYVDQAKLSVVFSNLLDNAIKYNVKGGSVTVKVERVKDSPYLLISVKDTGVGVPPEQVANLFKKFFRAENVTKFETEGTGLGLYIAKNIVIRHGGRIWAESTLNRGTTFFFTLPVDPKLIPPKEIGYEEL